jgi:flagellar biosynthesis protein FlhB
MADPSKTEKPTPRRKQEARKKGQVAKSVEATTAVSFITAIVLLKIYGKGIVEKLKSFIIYNFSHASEFDFTQEYISVLQLQVVTRMITILFPFMIGIVVAVIAINIAQVGFHISLESLKPDLKKINPISGLGKLFSKKGIENLLKSVFKVLFIGFVVYGVIKGEIHTLFLLITSDPVYSFYEVAGICYRIAIRIAIVFFIIGVADFSWQKYTHEQSLKMTKQEIKDESKRSEGNPQIKSEIRRRMREMLRNNMMGAVPEADVVVANPIHLAVALKYDASTMNSPKVVAKGARLIAQQIKDLAKENKIPVIEDKPLARALFQTAEVGDEVPEDLFNAVAEILTYVHKLTGKSFGL